MVTASLKVPFQKDKQTFDFDYLVPQLASSDGQGCTSTVDHLVHVRVSCFFVSLLCCNKLYCAMNKIMCHMLPYLLAVIHDELADHTPARSD